MKLFEKPTEKTEARTPSKGKEENIKRPLTDAVEYSPEKKKIASHEMKKKSDNRTAVTASQKSTRKLEFAQGKSLSFLLQKQIALKEGKITPKTLIDQSKIENVDVNSPKSDKFPTERRKSSDHSGKQIPISHFRRENQTTPEKEDVAIEKADSVSIRHSTTQSKSRWKSPSPLGRRKTDVKSVDSAKFLLIEPSLHSPRTERKENVDKETKGRDNRRHIKSEAKKPIVDDSIVGSQPNVLYDRTEKQTRSPKLNTYASDTAINNILNRDYSNQRSRLPPLVRKYADDLHIVRDGPTPMRSIENLYRSRSEENLAASPDDRNRKDTTMRRAKISVSDVNSSDNSNCPSAEPTALDTHVDTNNVSEVQTAGDAHGQILRHGYMTDDRTDGDGNVEDAITLMDRSEPIIDLTKDVDDVIVISDDNVVEISSDSNRLNEDEESGNMDKDGYPDSLNPFGEEEEDGKDFERSTEDIAFSETKNLNPFDENDEKSEDKAPEIDAIPTPNATENPIPDHLRTENVKKVSTNPFEEEEDEEEEEEEEEEEDQGHGEHSTVDRQVVPTIRKKISLLLEESTHEGDTPEYLRTTYVKRISVNPFEKEDDDDEEREKEEERNKDKLNNDNVSPRKRTVIAAPKISLSPFWSDAEDEQGESECDENEESPKPVPKPRKSRNATNELSTPEPKPRKSNQSMGMMSLGGFGSNSSLSSSQSGGHSARKKKPAPRPPIPPFSEQKIQSAPDSLTASPNTSLSLSPKLSAKTRKTKKAPLPPASTPLLLKSEHQRSPLSALEVSPIVHIPIECPATTDRDEWSNEKITKDLLNENRKSQNFNQTSDAPPPPTIEIETNYDHDNHLQHYMPNKSMFGKWKRKKGPAPSRPVPQRRTLKALPLSDFRKELDLIELQKQGLEKQGVRLEQIIRERCEGPEDGHYDDANLKYDIVPVNEKMVPIEVDDLILQLFEVVNEKNELSRREAELMYLQRQQRLEEEHAEVEYQIRCLMMQTEANKTDSDKAKEEELIQRLVEIVERRNEIVECLEMDRLREAEEDDSINSSLNSYASRRDGVGTSTTTLTSKEEEQHDGEVISKKEKKKAKKNKKSKNKNNQRQTDVDKDIDESETCNVKEKKKKKFSLF